MRREPIMPQEPIVPLKLPQRPSDEGWPAERGRGRPAAPGRRHAAALEVRGHHPRIGRHVVPHGARLALLYPSEGMKDPSVASNASSSCVWGVTGCRSHVAARSNPIA